MKDMKYDCLSFQDRELLDAAEEAMENAYNPYSKFFVGAALLASNGEIVTGSNVENAAYGGTVCAERAALMRGNAQGIREYVKVAVIARGEDFDTSEVTAPCGACRQVLYEFSQIAGEPIEVIMSNTDKSKVIIASIDELLPLAFGPKDLGVDLEKYRK